MDKRVETTVVMQLALEENGGYTPVPPRLLPGEILIKEAHKVILFPNAIDKRKGLMGDLFVSNCRIFLVPTDGADQTESPQLSNKLIGDYGVSLSNVDSVFQVSGSKKTRLFPGVSLNGRVKGLQVVCKNMRVMHLSFEQSPYDHGKHIARTVLHHAFPGIHSLLFAFAYSEPNRPDEGMRDVVMFSGQQDWAKEVKRSCRDHAPSWRVSLANRKFALCLHLPQWLVVPHFIVDSDVTDMSRVFRCDRPPTWSWSHPSGAALVRMADCLPAITDRTQENRFLERLRGLHPNKTAPVMLELDKLVPSVRDIQASYVKLRDLCIPESKRKFELQDSKWSQLLENSRWLHHVAACLREAVRAAQLLRSGTTVVLQEGDGRDTSAVVASLVQLMLDANSRSIAGFQSLIQKEWVAMGHPFCSRLGLTRDSGNEQSPVFALFLDCAWQVQRQFEASFEFSETYLTSLLDSCHISIFDTFLFDCERDRYIALESEPAPSQQRFRLRSVWKWSNQFSESDIALFKNPLYQLEDLVDLRSPKKSSSYVLPSHQVHLLELWAQCYFRWLPALGIRGGGRSQVDLIHRWLRSSIDASLAELRELTKRTPMELARGVNTSGPCPSLIGQLQREDADSLLLQLQCVDNFFPFARCEDSYAGLIADSSACSEFGSQSALNLTD